VVRVVAAASPRRVLIVNTNGGGHANIGFWLAKTLSGGGGTVLAVPIAPRPLPKKCLVMNPHTP